MIISIKTNAQTSINVTSCSELIYDNHIWSKSGIYSDTLTNQHGNDSIVIIDLTIIHPSYDTINAHICKNDVYSFFGSNLSSSGIYNHHLINHVGCDSIITLILNVDIINRSLYTYKDTLFCAVSGAHYQWFNCQTGLKMVGDTNQMLIPKLSGSYSVEIKLYNCIDTSFCHHCTVLLSAINNVNESNIKIVNTGNLISVIGCQVNYIRIFNSIGQLILTSNQNNISTFELSQSYYFLQIGYNDNQILISKIIK